MGEAIPDDAQLARVVIFPKCFGEGRLSNELMFDFTSDSDHRGYKVESLFWRRYVPDDHDLHAAGCHIARERNTYRGNPPSGPKRAYYVGYRQATAADLTLVDPTFETMVEHVPIDDGTDELPELAKRAHVHIALNVKAETKPLRARARTEAGSLLGAALGPVNPHVCQEDEVDGYHPLKRCPDCLEAA